MKHRTDTDEDTTPPAAGATTLERPTWEDVLAAVESDLRRTEGLLDRPRPVETVGAPAEAMLPQPQAPGEAHWAELPALEDMPPVPPELAGRIRELRANIVALQAEIVTEMAAWRATCARRSQPNSYTTAVAGAAFFVDRRV